MNPWMHCFPQTSHPPHGPMPGSPHTSRRDFLAGAAACVGFGAAAFLPSTGEARPSSIATEGDSLLCKGDSFNESVEFADSFTGRSSRSLTTQRQFNEQPTYHLNTAFSPDSRFLLLGTTLNDGGTALLRAEVATGEITVLDVGTASQPLTIWNSAVIPALNSVAVVTGDSVRLIDLATLRERTVLAGTPGLRAPAGSCDGRRLFVLRRAAPVMVDGVKVTPAVHCEIDLASGRLREVFREARAQCNHLVPCPTDPDLLLIDRDLPPKFGGGGDGRTSRVWTLHTKSAALVEIRPRDPNRFQIHSNWSHCGQFVYYHGTAQKHSYPTSPAGHFVGVADRAGRVVWEGHFPQFHYGHVGTHTRSHAILADALFSRNLITAVHWRDCNVEGIPRFEVLACHDTNWVPGQASHPHPHMSPDGKWLSYNRGIAAGGANAVGATPLKNIYGEVVGAAPLRSDVCVVRL